MEDTHERYRRTDLPALPAPHPERYVAWRLSRRGFSVGSQHRNLLAVWFRRSRRTWRNPTRPMADRSEPTTRKTKLHRKVARTMNLDWRRTLTGACAGQIACVLPRPVTLTIDVTAPVLNSSNTPRRLGYWARSPRPVWGFCFTSPSAFVRCRVRRPSWLEAETLEALLLLIRE